jgi:hypothetical protein
MAKKLTIKELLAQKDQLKKKLKRVQDLYVESLDAEITIQEPEREIALEGLEMAQEGKSDEADVYIVYNSVIEPNLKDKELQKEYSCVEPTDIVKMLFRSGEISAISGFALQLAGYGQGVQKVDRDIKN